MGSKPGATHTVNVLANDTCSGIRPCPAARVKMNLVTPLPRNITASVTSAKQITIKVGSHRKLGAVRVRYRLTQNGRSVVASIWVHVWAPRWAPAHMSTGIGPNFNNPTGGRTARRAVVRHVVKAIDSVPGYRVDSRAQCPKVRALWPNEIKVSLYSLADRNFADALIRADRRCVSVQLLMNDHLNAHTSKSWGSLLHALGNNRSARSWTYRCRSGCRTGRGVEHAKFYLFSQVGTTKNVVMAGSSNMTSNATGVQWNDLFTTHSTALYSDFRSVFEEMAPDKKVFHPFRLFNTGPYQAAFWPQPGAKADTDQVMKWLRSISCSGATGGAGINGHSVIYINIHAWHSERGAWLAQEVKNLYNHGCYVRILYSFMGHGIFNYLKSGTGSRMVVRRTIFPHDPPRYDADGIAMASLYSHMKNFNVSGNVAGDSSAWVTWTGSNNFTGLGLHSDEVVLRIASRRVYNAYVAHWKFISQTRSSPIWAHYDEPQGGGRAPEDPARMMTRSQLQSLTPVQRMMLDDELPGLSTAGQDMD
ncbi:phospholipase D-like domain-containing protein [Nocardioides montaniterrae]